MPPSIELLPEKSGDYDFQLINERFVFTAYVGLNYVIEVHDEVARDKVAILFVPIAFAQ